jgi:hypothetical protein
MPVQTGFGMTDDSQHDALDDDEIAFIEGYSADVTPQLLALIEREYLPLWITAATTPRPGTKTKSSRAARELCSVAALCLEREQQMPVALRLYLARAMREIAEGGDADKALGTRRGAGQGSHDDPLDRIAKEQAIAGEIAVLVAAGMTIPAAKEIVCERHSTANRTADMRKIERYWKKHRPSEKDLAEIRHRMSYRHRLARDSK